MTAIRRLAAGMAVLALGGCGGPTTQQDLSACQMEAYRTYSHVSRADPNKQNDVADFAYLCMESKGYEQAPLGKPFKDCNLTGYAAEVSAECYQKRGWL